MISLFLMSKKGFSVLRALIDNKFNDVIEKVICSKDSSIPYDYYDDIKALCEKNKIPFFDKKDSYVISSPYAYAVSWRWILKMKKTKLIIFHDSLLPKYRGFNPLVSCLLNEETEIGVTALFAREQFDTGPIIAQSSKNITYPIKLEKAIDIICESYVSLCLDITRKIRGKEELNSYMQQETRATYSVWRDEEDYRIDWTKSSKEIRLKIDSLGFPYRGASCYIDGRKARILEAEEYHNLTLENRTPGKLLLKENDYPVIICGYGLILLKKIIYDDNHKDAIPLKKFRVRFT